MNEDSHSIVASPLGYLFLEATQNGLSKLEFLRKNLPSRVKTSSNRFIRQAQRELGEYFQGRRKKFSVSLDLQGTSFQKKVWKALSKIPHGEVRSYSHIAKAVRNPKSFRAIGMANHRNPVAIIVPCHRVIGKQGDLVGYACGLDLKKKLLELEGFSVGEKRMNFRRRKSAKVYVSRSPHSQSRRALSV